MANIMTLKAWQTYVKFAEHYIIQASTVDGADGATAPPIGMGFHFIHYKNKDLKPTQFGQHDQLALCAISTETDKRRRGPVRQAIVQMLSDKGIQNLSIIPIDYFALLPSYKFVVSPEGNGIDCHRHYEALMAGCIPIVEDHPLIRAKYGNVPILWTKDYSEITPEYLEAKYAELLDTTWDFTRLYLCTYSFEEQFIAQYRGNYWTQKLTGQTWYNFDDMNTGIYVDKNKAFYLKAGIFQLN